MNDPLSVRTPAAAPPERTPGILPLPHLVLRFARHWVDRLPDLLLRALIPHELAHAYLHLTDRPRHGDEVAVNMQAWLWGFDIPGLKRHLGRKWTRSLSILSRSL
jgi:hypothetical protein